MATIETRERIVATAAQLFAKFGFHGVSLRQIAKEAGIQASLAQYHFKTKEAVFRAVFERCILPINHDRLSRLDKCAMERAAGGDVALEDTVRAFVEPTVQVARQKNPSTSHYAELIAQIQNDPQEHARRISREFTDPIARQTLAALRVQLPDLDEGTLTWCYMFGVGAMIAAISRTGRARLLSGGACDPDDTERIVSLLVPFMAGGMRAVAEASASAARGKSKPKPRMRRGGEPPAEAEPKAPSRTRRTRKETTA